MTIPAELLPLLDHLAHVERPSEQQWRTWSIGQVHGGANNLLFRATRDDVDLAVKFTLRDARNRAGREFAALHALRQLVVAVAPEPVCLEQQRYTLP